jgi:hypothetical protein
MCAALDRAWSSLPPDRQTPESKSTLAIAILGLATRGERDSVRLSRDALNAIATEGNGETESADAQVETVAQGRNAHDV